MRAVYILLVFVSLCACKKGGDKASGGGHTQQEADALAARVKSAMESGDMAQVDSDFELSSASTYDDIVSKHSAVASASIKDMAKDGDRYRFTIEGKLTDNDLFFLYECTAGDVDGVLKIKSDGYNCDNAGIRTGCITAN